MYMMGMGEFLPSRKLNPQLEKDCTDPNYNKACMNSYTYLFTRFSKQINQVKIYLWFYILINIIRISY
jgi:hypothetical protein